MKIVVAGETGRLGSELIKLGCKPLGCANIADSSLVDVAIKSCKPDVLINCAAYTKVDACEDEKTYRDIAIPVNVKGPIYLALSCLEKGAHFIHLSSDYVFGGKHGPYSEDHVASDDDVPSKKSGYSITKLGAEVALTALGGITIVRTTGLFGPRGDDFVGTVRSFLSAGQDLNVTRNLHGNQTYTPYLAEALVQLAQMDHKPTLIHLASEDILTRYEFALMIASVFGFDKSLLHPVLSSQIPGWKAVRPVHGGLKVDLAKKLGLPIHRIVDGLEALKSHV